MNKVTFMNNRGQSAKVTKDRSPSPTHSFLKMRAQQRNRQFELVRSLQKWNQIVMMPDHDLVSNEPIRPFLILQPQAKTLKGT